MQSDASVTAIALEPPEAAAGSGVGYEQLAPHFLAGRENCLVVDLFESPPVSGLSSYSPIYLYGPSGGGKTALAVTLLRRWGRGNPNGRIVQAAAIDFARQLAGAIACDDTPRFRSRYRDADALLIDALEDLVGRDAAQGELVRTIDHLHERGKPVIVTAADLPQLLGGLSEPLVSRLIAGACVPVSLPGREAYRAALDRFAGEDRRTAAIVDSAVREAMLERLPRRTTIFALRGIFREYVGFCSGDAEDAGEETLRRRRSEGTVSSRSQAVIDSAIRKRDPRAALTPAAVSRVVAKHGGCTMAELKGDSRRSGIVRGRSIAMYLCRDLLQMSLLRIGRYFGGRDHTTVLHAVRKIEQQLPEDPSLRRTIDEIRSRITRRR